MDPKLELDLRHLREEKTLLIDFQVKTHQVTWSKSSCNLQLHWLQQKWFIIFDNRGRSRLPECAGEKLGFESGFQARGSSGRVRIVPDQQSQSFLFLL